jgi:signal peptidase I
MKQRSNLVNPPPMPQAASEAGTVRSAIQFAVGLVVISVIARVFLVMGLIVPVTIAGSSMSPTLNGPHIEVVCPQCGAIVQVGTDQLPPGANALCPNCDARLHIDGLPILDGDSIWVDRTAFTLRPPRRWEVVVFQCPNDATRLCVKRVLGLPGERIAFRNGELLVDGRHVAKPVDVAYELRPGDGVGQAGYDVRQQCWQLEDGYFVVGDNQVVSLDSRNWAGGPDLPARLLIGRPIGRY